MIEIMEELVELMTGVPSYLFGDHLKVFVPELPGEATKHGSNCQVVLVMPVETCRVEYHYRTRAEIA